VGRGVFATHPCPVKNPLAALRLDRDRPVPHSPEILAATLTGFLDPGMVGLTLGHSVFICRGHETVRLLSHEFRHVYQYEQAGSIADFLPGYLLQIVQRGYAATTFETDAIAYERTDL